MGDVSSERKKKGEHKHVKIRDSKLSHHNNNIKEKESYHLQFPSCISLFLPHTHTNMGCLSRTKVENILSLTFNGINIALCLLVIAAAIIKAIKGNFSQIVMCIYGG